MWLACGTVFNEVLLWKVTDKSQCSCDGKVLVKKRLTGHDGVIFSVRYSEDRGLLCSVSDDRSIQVWRAVFAPDYSDVTVSAKPLLTLYGHKARVWDCLILKNHIVSIGEDSMYLLWNSDGKIIRSWKGHIGKSIWSLACTTDEQTIATGGGDGAIRLWMLENDVENTRKEHHFVSSIPQQQEMTTSQTKEETPRLIGLLQDASVLIMTDQGNLYNFTWKHGGTLQSPGIWSLIHHEPAYASYSIMALSDCRTIVALGNLNGSIKLISLTELSWCALERKPYTDKVLSLHWIKDERGEGNFHLFSCGPEGLVIWWSVEGRGKSKEFHCEVKARFRLPYCRQRWPNSVFLVDGDSLCSTFLLCGDRRGSLHVFKATNENEATDPKQSLIGIHGRNGVTSICRNSGYIYTTGRDGCIRQYTLSEGELELLDKRKVYKGMEWIDRVNFTPEGEVLVYGFHTVDFIIWSMTRNEVLFRIPCGGGHRNWDISSTTTNHDLVFTYLKQSSIHLHIFSAIQKQQSSSIIQESFHGRETNCVRFIRPLQKTSEEIQLSSLLVTGSEDTTINIMSYNPQEINRQRFRKVASCEGHISSVRCLAYIELNPQDSEETPSLKHLIFSGGSRASIKCWSLDVDNILSDKKSDSSSEEGASLHSSCTLFAELRSLSRRSRKKKRLRHDVDVGDFSCDVRIMSLSILPLAEILPDPGGSLMDIRPNAVGVIAACSDGYLRFYVFDYKLKTFTNIGRGKCNERCLLRTGHFNHIISAKTHVVVYASDTAGYISFWDVTHMYVEHCARFYKNTDDLDAIDEQLCKLDMEDDGPVLDDDDFQTGSAVKCSNDRIMLSSKNDHIRRPFCSCKIHQSGVNSISLLRKDDGSFVLCSGGDDGAVVFTTFKIHGSNEKVELGCWDMVSIPDAHTSAVTGVKLLDSETAVSTSVDQRMKLWSMDWSEEGTKLCAVNLIDIFWLDVVDIQDIDVLRNNNGTYSIAACGVGLQMLTLKSLCP
ncbi:WD repeat-containing protein 6-like isoform X2 [Dendronephthya gigantea]|nr:WD repeat-containing protein 6-like isoform X2 [Dendronephthya gigantea]